MNGFVPAGIDVSAKTLDVTVFPDNGSRRKRRRFDNDAQGHQRLIEWLSTWVNVRVVCEATGVYYLDMAFALHAAGVALMVANPRQAKRFIEARACNVQSDAIDADEMAEYARRMDFVPWQAPSAQAFALHKLGRAIGQMTKRHTAVSNRLHAARACTHTPGAIAASLGRELAFLEAERSALAAEASAIIAADPQLVRKRALLLSVTGIAKVNAPAILAELVMLPRGLAAKAWVKNAGLDPSSKSSGSSVQSVTRIAKRGNARLRAALYMVALTARIHDPHMRAFADRLVAHHKTPLQAVVAIQRKLLHGIHAMFQQDVPWNSSRLVNDEKPLAA